MDEKISGVVILDVVIRGTIVCIIVPCEYNLHDCTFKFQQT